MTSITNGGTSLRKIQVRWYVCLDCPTDTMTGVHSHKEVALHQFTAHHMAHLPRGRSFDVNHYFPGKSHQSVHLSNFQTDLPRGFGGGKPPPSPGNQPRGL